MGCFFVSKRLRLLNPWVQGLLAINGSSVGSVGKGPLDLFLIPPHPIFRVKRDGLQRKQLAHIG